MTNTILFLNSFLSYLLLFAIIVVLVIIACVIGIKWRKAKDAREALENGIPENEGKKRAASLTTEGNEKGIL